MFHTYFGYTYIISPNYRKTSKEGFFQRSATPNTKLN